MSSQNENGSIPHNEPGLKPHKIRDSGKVVFIKRINPLITRELIRAFPPPKPPMIEIEVLGEKTMEPNDSDPDYLKAKEQHEEEFQRQLTRFMLRRGVHFEMTDEIRQEVKELREDMAGLSVELPENDRDVWLLYLATSSDGDVKELFEAISRRSMPTEDSILEAAENFSGEV